MQVGELFILGFFGKVIPDWLSEFAARFGLGGVMLGSSFAPAVLARFGDWIATMAGLALYVGLVTGILYWYFRKYGHFDRVTAFFAASPGGLNEMTIVGRELGGDDRLIALVHGPRILMVVMIIPIGFMIFDTVRAHRMRAEAEAAAVAPLVSTGAPDPLAGPPVPIALSVDEPVQVQPVEMGAPAAGQEARMRKARKKVAAPAAPLTGELVITSVPDGAHVQVDGAGGWTTPVSIGNVGPGQHAVALSKPGYMSETKTVAVNANTKSFVAVSMTQLAATASIASEPAGASIFVDGHDSGKVTPAKLVLNQGNHSVSLRKAGYLETSTSISLNAGDTFQFMPTLKPLGNADDIKQVGKFKKLIGRGGQETAGRVMVHTFPKGAQIMFNERMMDHASPAEFLLSPGSYEVNLTLTGYKPIHTVITVEPGARLEVDQTFQR